MPRVIIDWDQKYKKAIIISEFLEIIRASFSVPNNNKQMLKRMGRPTWHMADFISPISSTGRFDMGLYFEIISHLKQNKNTEYEITTTNLLQSQLIQTYSWNREYNIHKLKIELRPYQESGVKKSIHMGYGTLIIGTAGGKTLLMASLIETIRTYELPFITLVILPSNLIEQTYKEFASYGVLESEMSMWGGDSDFNKKPIILAGTEILRANLAIFSERNPKLEYKWKSENSKGTYKEYLDEFADNEKARKSKWTLRRKELLKSLADVELLLLDECIHGDSLIITPSGKRKIIDIKENDFVLSFNIKENVNEYKRVKKIHTNMKKSMECQCFIKITLENDTYIKITPNHKIYTTNRGYVVADALKENDDIKIF